VQKESAAVNQSAFMLDLSQMAAIFKHATARSLCLVDEFGKGTNAQDGIALLYASLDELLRRGANCPRVLACTHYTELLEIPRFKQQPGLSLWTMQVLLRDARADDDDEPADAGAAADAAGDAADARAAAEWRLEREADDEAEEAAAAGSDWHGDHIAPLSAALDEEIVFLYKAVRGACTDSFGCHVASPCNLPATVIQRARHISHCRLEGNPIERFDVDTAAAAATERNLAHLVDSFLQFDFGTHTADAFFASTDHIFAELNQ
jgi:DNA mismatch repair protein MSH5